MIELIYKSICKLIAPLCANLSPSGLQECPALLSSMTFSFIDNFGILIEIAQLQLAKSLSFAALLEQISQISHLSWMNNSKMTRMIAISVKAKLDGISRCEQEK